MFTNPATRSDTPMSSMSSEYNDIFLGTDLQKSDHWDHTLPSFHSPAPLRTANMQFERAMQQASSAQGLQSGLSSLSTSGYDVRVLLQRIKELEAQHALLTQRVFELQGELAGSRAAYNALLERLPSDGSPIASGEDTTHVVRAAPPSTTAEAVLFAVRNPPRIVTLNRNDHRRIRFWSSSEFTQWHKKEMDTSPLGPDAARASAALVYAFLEDETGQCIEGKRYLMLEVLYSVWRSLLHAPDLLPETWGKASFEVNIYVWATLEEAFVELRFCEGHWKAQKLCTLNYSWWHTRNVLPVLAIKESDSDDDERKSGLSGGRQASSTIGGKRKAEEPTSKVVIKKPKNKVQSVFAKASRKKEPTPAPAPLSSVTSTVTSTVIDAARSSQPTTTTTTASTTKSPSPSSTTTIDAPADADISGVHSTPNPVDQSTTNPALTHQSRRVQDDIASSDGQGTQVASGSATTSQEEPRVGSTAPALPTKDAHPPSGDEANNPPPTPQSIPTSLLADSSSGSASATFIYPSVTIPATGKVGHITATPTTTASSSEPSMVLSIPQSSPSQAPPRDSIPIATISADSTAASGSVNAVTPAGSDTLPSGKKVTGRALCRQGYERAHPGVDKKTMTSLFREHWNQMDKNKRKEWDEKARLANGSQAQAAQAVLAA